MEHLVKDLKENLVIRRKKEYSQMEQWNKENKKELSLISSGRIIELDFIINALSELLNYYKTQRNTG